MVAMNPLPQQLVVKGRGKLNFFLREADHFFKIGGHETLYIYIPSGIPGI